MELKKFRKWMEEKDFKWDDRGYYYFLVSDGAHATMAVAPLSKQMLYGYYTEYLCENAPEHGCDTFEEAYKMQLEWVKELEE